MASSAAATAHNAYELAREQRIQKNLERMASLGVVSAMREVEAHARPRPSEPAAPAHKKRKGWKAAGDAEGEGAEGRDLRRSRRQQGLASKLEEQSGSAVPAEKVHRLAPRAAPASGLSEEDYNHHNEYRLTTMSEQALHTRIWKIRNVAKMKSFVQVLRDSGRQDLVEEAEEALLLLTGPRPVLG